MNRFVINGRFLSRKKTGVDRYAFEIIQELDKIAEPGILELAIPKNAISVPNLKNIRIVKVGINKGNLWEQLDFAFYAIKNKRKTINFCNTAPLIKPDVVTIFDTKINDHPEFYSKLFVLWYKLQFSNSLKKADIIITDSYSAKNDIIRNYPSTDSEKIEVVYSSWQHMERIGYDEDALKKYDLVDKSYYFSLSSIEPNKNLKWIIEAGKDNTDQLFAIAGKTEGIYNNEKISSLPENIKLLGYVSDEETKTLMNNCKAFIFPSFSEGFGLPPLEGLCSGCDSLIVSDIPVMHEIFGEAVSYIDPYKYNKNALRCKKITSGEKERILSSYSWKNSSETLYKILRRL